MGNFAQSMPSAAIQQAVSQLPQQPTNMVGQPVTGGGSQPQAGQLAGKGGQPPSPQALSQGLQQQQAMQAAMQQGKGGQPPAPQGQIPMSMQRQPQGGMAGRNMPARLASRGLR